LPCSPSPQSLGGRGPREPGKRTQQNKKIENKRGRRDCRFVVVDWTLGSSTPLIHSFTFLPDMDDGATIAQLRAENAALRTLVEDLRRQLSQSHQPTSVAGRLTTSALTEEERRLLAQLPLPPTAPQPPPPARPMAAMATLNEEDVAQLMSLGFSRQECVSALFRHSSPEAAAEALLNSQEMTVVCGQARQNQESLTCLLLCFHRARCPRQAMKRRPEHLRRMQMLHS
jgi:hypothetical protein